MKKIFKMAFLAAFVLAAGYNVYSSCRTEVTFSDLFIDNVEALAGEAGPDWNHHKRITKESKECCESGWANYKCSGGLKQC